MSRIKYNQLHIACTPQELKAFRKMAEAEHLPLGTFIKQLLHKHLEALDKEASA
jgi:hypothetical protein